MMSTFSLPKISLVSVAVLLVLITYLYLAFFSNENHKDITQLLITNSDRIISDRINNAAMKTDKQGKTIATEWQWEESADIKKEKYSPLFSEEAVYNNLHRVRLDNQDNVIIDHQALIALNETLNDSRLQLDDEALRQLQIIIRQGLPGNTGDEVAEIVANYYHYLEASKEFNAIYETDSSITLDSESTLEGTIEESEANYRELVALRELYLGSENSTKLFSTTNANATYMFDMYKIEKSTGLTDEDKQQQYDKIIEQHTKQTIPVSNWNQRHIDFLASKQHILSASISDEETQVQLTELMHQHFNSKELAHISHLQLDKP